MNTATLWRESQIIVKIRPPAYNESLGCNEYDTLNKCELLICYTYLATEKDLLNNLLKNPNKNLSVLSLDSTPRITRAQKLDTLSSTTNLAGYRAVIEAFNHFPRFSKSQITAAGKVPPAKIFVIGCGVAGLAAIGVAGGLGCEIRAFDTRKAAQEQVESLGGTIVKMDYEESGEGSGGYGKQMSDAYYESQKKMVIQQAREVDIIITTALIPGQKAPILVPKEAVRAMKSGSVIVDMAAERGGNCELTKSGETFVDNLSGVTIIGETDFPSKMASQSSELFAANMWNLLEEMMGAHTSPVNNAKDFKIDFDDEVINAMAIVKNGQDFVTNKPKPVAVQPVQSQPKPSPVQGNQKKGYDKLEDEEEEEIVESQSFFQSPVFVATALFLSCLVFDILLSMATNLIFIQSLGIFILSIFIGYLIIWNVTPSLHTPLMSVTNAISGIIVVGCMITLINKKGHSAFLEGYSTLAFFGVFFASINVFGGFIVTQRMLNMFRKG